MPSKKPTQIINLHLKQNQLNKCIQQNHKIINLIKRKLTPLHPTKNLRKTQDINKTKNSSFEKVRKEYQVIPEVEIERLELMAHNINNKILDRTRKYLSEKKRCNVRDENENKNKKTNVSMFLRIFEDKEKRSQEEFEELLKMKRELNRDASGQKTFIADFDVSRLPDTTDQENELMNAKLRQKLNHKKIIGLFKLI